MNSSLSSPYYLGRKSSPFNTLHFSPTHKRKIHLLFTPLSPLTSSSSPTTDIPGGEHHGEGVWAAASHPVQFGASAGGGIHGGVWQAGWWSVAISQGCHHPASHPYCAVWPTGVWVCVWMCLWGDRNSEFEVCQYSIENYESIRYNTFFPWYFEQVIIMI